MDLDFVRLRMRFPTTTVVSIFVVAVHFLIPVLCQNSFANDPKDHTAHTNTFYLASKSDCSNDLKNIFDYTAIVNGYDLNNIGTGPTSCTIRITSQSTFPGIYLRLTIVAMDIQDCRTQLTIFDGETTQILGSYDCRSSKNENRKPIPTSGDTVTFIMTRANPDNHQFDIEVRVQPIRSGVDPDNDYNYFSFQKFDQEAIVGMIGGLYALVLVICISIVCYCNIRYRGLNKKWETHQLATMKTDTSFEARSQASQPAWSVPSQSRGPMSTYARSYATTTEPFSRKGPYPRSEDGSSGVYDHDEKFQQRNLMNDGRDGRRGRDRMATQNNTYSDEEEDPDNFKEKVITPRVKTSAGARWKPQDRRDRDRRPPSFEEATRASSSERSSDEETEEETESSDNDSTRKRLTTSSEGDDSDDYTETETESESESSRASSSRRGGGARATRPKKKSASKSKAKAKSKRRRQSSTDDASSQRTSEPRKNGRRPQQQQQQPPPPMPGAMPYGAYPPPPGGQFVPIMTGHPHPQFQPVPMMPPSYPPPQYPMDPTPTNQHPLSQGNVKPTDPPVYSYLVQRGYTPMDPNNPNDKRNSPAPSSVSSQQRGPPPARSRREEPDTPLQSGVEYMRR